MSDETKHRLIDPRISVGNILAIAAMVIGGFSAWYNMRTEVVQINQAMAFQTEAARNERVRMNIRLDKIETERDDTRDRLIRVEILLQSIADRIGATKD